MSSLRKTANRQTQPKQKKQVAPLAFGFTQMTHLKVLFVWENGPHHSRPASASEFSGHLTNITMISISSLSSHHWKSVFVRLFVCFGLFLGQRKSSVLWNAEPWCCWLCRVGIIPGRRHCPVVLTVSPFAVATAKAVTCGGMQRCFLRFLGLRHWFPCWTFAMMQQGLVLVL